MVKTITKLSPEEIEKQAQGIVDALNKQIEPKILRNFFELFSEEIYNFPIKYNNFTEDEAADFYLYAFEHLKNGKKLTSFQGKSKFSTWFHSVLRNLVIDFLRTKRHRLKVYSLNVLTPEGIESDFAQKIPDITGEMGEHENEMLEKFFAFVENIGIQQRLLLKLAYIHYFEFTKEEIDWLSSYNETSHAEILKILGRLKNIALEKANFIRKLEDKLTALYLAIDNLEHKLSVFFSEHPGLSKNQNDWSESYTNPEIPEEINQIIRMLCRRRNQQLVLIQNQQKSLLATRIPYKEFSSLLKSTEGVLSVQLSRLLKKINDELL